MKAVVLLLCVALKFCSAFNLARGFRPLTVTCPRSYGDVSRSGERFGVGRLSSSGHGGRGKSVRAATSMVERADPDRYGAAIATTAAATIGAIAFGAGVNEALGIDKALQFFAGYVVEMSLSVDNLFVFLLLFKFFKVPFDSQNRVLTYGIFGAVVMRAIFIGLGEAAMSVFHPILLGFAGILIFSSYTLLSESEGDGDEDLSDNKLVAFASSTLDATESYDGDKFFTMVDGVRRATPLLLVLVCVELSDIVFAVDSIPAVFAVTKDPFIVYTSNIWAILNLRSLFTLLASAVEDLVYLRPAVAAVLGFVGCKIGGEFFGCDVSTELSLGIITGVLAAGVAASLILPGDKTDPT